MQYENIFLPEFRFRPLKSCMAVFYILDLVFSIDFYILVHKVHNFFAVDDGIITSNQYQIKEYC